MATSHFNKPDPAILIIWRIGLALSVAIPALLNSLLFTVGGRLWLGITGIWCILFLFFYLFYLPVRYHRFAYRITEDAILVKSGVFYNNTSSLPLINIQFVALTNNPIGRVFHLCTVRVVAPGARLNLPGLRREEAERILQVIPHTSPKQSGN